MELQNILYKYNDLINKIIFNRSSFKKGKIIKNSGATLNYLKSNLINDLISLYEKESYKDIFCFEINTNDIKKTKIKDNYEFEKSFFNSDLMHITIGPFSMDKNTLEKDSNIHIWAQSSAGVFYAQLYPFKIKINDLNNGLKSA